MTQRDRRIQRESDVIGAPALTVVGVDERLLIFVLIPAAISAGVDAGPTQMLRTTDAPHSTSLRI